MACENCTCNQNCLTEGCQCTNCVCVKRNNDPFLGDLGPLSVMVTKKGRGSLPSPFYFNLK